MHALNELTERILGAAIEVHRMTGPGLLESAYEECLGYELSRLGLEFKGQVQLPIAYKGLKLDCGYRLDLLLEDSVIVAQGPRSSAVVGENNRSVDELQRACLKGRSETLNELRSSLGLCVFVVKKR